MRFRTAGGAQVLMDDTTSTVYVTNTNGTAWVELTANGKIELWGADSISMRSEKDFNIRADRDINIESGRHINIKTYHTTQSPPPATDSDQPKSTIDLPDVQGDVFFDVSGKFKLKSTGGTDLSTAMTTNIYSNVDNNLTALGGSNINSAGGHKETAATIHMNGPEATKATELTAMEDMLYTNVLEERTAATPIYSPRKTEPNMKSILTRYTTREPDPSHEAKSLENATIVDSSVTETQIADAKETYIATKSVADNEIKAIEDTVIKQVDDNMQETYTSLVDETIGQISDELKEVTNKIKQALKSNLDFISNLDLSDTNQAKAFDDLILVNEDVQKNIVLPHLTAKEFLKKNSPQDIHPPSKKTITKTTTDFVNFKDV
jgi:hypothetical protein